MYQKVLGTCRKYASVYAGVPAFGQAVAQLDGNIADIVRKAQEQSGAQGKAQQKYGSAYFYFSVLSAVERLKKLRR
ncbi:MAG: hypothetical protein LBL04_15245 [Bacteroidales bacterium]|jgi:hypothetical protein|nr:hypothetical protein [Bacteroidales bacterium]